MTATTPTEAAPTVDSPAIRVLQLPTFRVVVISQILGGAGLAAGVTVGALFAEGMLDRDGVAGIPPRCSRSAPR